MNWVSGTFSSSTVYQYYPFDYHLLNQYQYKVCKHVATISYFPVALFIILSNIDYHLLNQYQYKVYKKVVAISYLLQPMVHMQFVNAFCCGVLITHLQHHNKHEYNIDSLLNIQFVTVLLQHYITYLQQHKQYKYNVGKI